MKRKIELCMVLLLLLGMLVAGKKLSELVGSENVKSVETIVVLDAGHGGKDPGKVGTSGVLEKEINLQIAQKVKKQLGKKGIKVVMTRENDVMEDSKMADMKKRVNLINKTKPDITVSIHQNSYSDKNVRGAQVFYYTHSEDSKKAAVYMQQELKQVDAENTRAIKDNNIFYLLKKTEKPTIIVECGFLSNPEEEAKLATEDYQEKMAEAICKGVLKWLEDKEK